MATKTLYNSPTVNPFSFLQEEGQVDAQAAKGPKKDDANAVLTPAQKAERRAQANAEKAKEQEAAKQKAQADAALAALVGPLDDFVTQKGAKKTEQRNEKKLKREEFEASAVNKDKTPEERQRKNDGEKRPYDGPKKDRAPGEKKQYNRDGGSGHFEPKRERDQNKKHQGYQPPRRGREYDKHSAGKTPNKPEDKRGGDGAANWGNPITDATPVPTESGWGDEGEPQTPEEKDVQTPAEEKKEEDTQKRPSEPAWDDEGFNKMTLAEFQSKVAAEKAAALAKQVGVVQPRERDLNGVDLSKFVEKDNYLDDDKYAKKSEKKEKKKPAAGVRPGEKAVNLTDVFSVGRPGGRGGRGGRGGDRPQQGDRENKPRGQGRGNRGGEFAHKVPPTKQFPELSAAVNK